MNIVCISNAAYRFGQRKEARKIIKEIASDYSYSVVNMFSKMLTKFWTKVYSKVVFNHFEEFREKWNAQYIDGFIVSSKLFEGLKGKFPIGFLLWKTDNRENAKKISIDEISPVG